MDTWGHRHVVFDNRDDHFPESILSVAFYHGRNAVPEDQWMAGLGGDEYVGRCRISADDLHFLTAVVFKEYGLLASDAFVDGQYRGNLTEETYVQEPAVR